MVFVAWFVRPITYDGSVLLFGIHFLSFSSTTGVHAELVKRPGSGRNRIAAQTALILRHMKNHLIAGGHVIIRKCLGSIAIKQGPKERRRSEVDGLLQIAGTVSPDGGSLATRVDSEKAVYIFSEGADLPTVASVSEYYVIGANSESTSSDGPPSVSMSHTLRRRTSLAWFVSLITMLAQGLAWVARNAQFSIHPYVLLVTVFVAVCIGLSVQVALALMCLFRQSGRARLAFREELLAQPFGEDWYWGVGVTIFPFCQILLWTTVWDWCRFGPKTHNAAQSNTPSSDSAKPIAPTVIPIPKVVNPAISDTSSNASTGVGFPPTLSDWQAGLLQREGIPPTRPAASCVGKASFVDPSFGLGKLTCPQRSTQEATSLHLNHQEIFSVCANRQIQYMSHVNNCNCLVAGYNAHGSEFHPKNNVTVRECPTRAKLRALQGNWAIPLPAPHGPLPRQHSSHAVATEPVSPTMPRLEARPPISVNSEKYPLPALLVFSTCGWEILRASPLSPNGQLGMGNVIRNPLFPGNDIAVISLILAIDRRGFISRDALRNSRMTVRNLYRSRKRYTYRIPLRRNYREALNLPGAVGGVQYPRNPPLGQAVVRIPALPQTRMGLLTRRLLRDAKVASVRTKDE